MAGFLYFEEKRRTPPSLADLDALGLAYAFDSDGVSSRGCERGPGAGDGGMVFAEAGRVESKDVGYFPNVQTWRPIPGADGLLVGHYTDERRPTPADLQRTQERPGHVVRAADKSSWLAPIAHQWTFDSGKPEGVCAVPRSLDMNSDGEWTRSGVGGRDKELWDYATRWFDVFMAADVGGGRVEYKVAEIADWAAFALQTNYVVSKVEIAMLGLFDDRSMSDVLNALVDAPTLLEWLDAEQKKRWKRHPNEVAVDPTSNMAAREKPWIRADVRRPSVGGVDVR